MKPILSPAAAFLLFVLGCCACASIGNPDGGPYDETPPRFLRATPPPNTTGVQRKKITLEFDEFIKLEKASEKVIISPPQEVAPEVKAVGRKVQVSFEDSLKANTTYTIDFGDAIVDNNEGNPLGQFAYAFATGETVDTLEVSGTVLNAENLEPIKGIQVGLHKNLNDTAFTSLPFDRISRTDSRGRFTIRGIAPGTYRVFALMDGNQNYLFDSKTEAVAWMDSLVVPRCEAAVRQDTLWATPDSSRIDTIRRVAYTRFLPDDLLLRAFTEVNDLQYLTKSERPKTHQIALYFAAKADTLPTLTGLNFDEREAFVVEPTRQNDSILYWLRDTVLAERDTLLFRLDYLATDTLGQLVPRTDTLRLLNKVPRERRLALKQEELKKQEKERRRRAKRGDTLAVKTPFLPMNLTVASALDLGQNVRLSFDEPLAAIDTAALHVETLVDSLWQEVPFLFRADSAAHRRYELLAGWQPGREYRVRIDSLAFRGLYGLWTDKKESKFKIKTLEDYGTLYLNIKGARSRAIAQLLNSSDAVVRQERVKPDGTCDFYFLKPGTKYYLRLFHDDNGNGRWDTGSYAEKRPPEEVFYSNKVWEMKANFEFEEDWDLYALPLDRQKLDELKKQKPDEAKKVKERNKERAKKLGKTTD